MAERYSLGPLHLLPAGEGRNFKLGDRKVAVFRTRDGGVFATQEAARTGRDRWPMGCSAATRWSVRFTTGCST